MKLLNYTTSYLAVILLVVISIWAAVFYYSMLDEIYDSIDDGLDNQKGMIVHKAAQDTSLLHQTEFTEGDYAIREIGPQGIRFTDIYIDTLMYMQNESDYEPARLLRTVFQQNGKYYQLDVITSMVEEDDLSSALLYALLWLYLGLVATILLLNNWLLKRIWKPFYELLRQMSAFRLEQPGPITPPRTRIDEFKALHETVENLLQSNISSYRSQKEFIENAAHELQTPLAITIGKLEALTQRSEFSGQELQLVTSAMDNLQRLVRLNRSLLLISRIHNRQFTSEAGINLNELTRKILDDFSDQASYQDIKITFTENGACRAEMNEDLAHILITNLVKNALTHNHKGGFIKVEMLDHGLRIQNSGEEKSLDATAIFTRFYHASHTERSTGLGLSIVRAICDLYHFRIVYRHENAHVFIVDFMNKNA